MSGFMHAGHFILRFDLVFCEKKIRGRMHRKVIMKAHNKGKDNYRCQDGK